MAEIGVRYEVDTSAIVKVLTEFSEMFQDVRLSMREFFLTAYYSMLILTKSNPVQQWYKFRLKFLPFENGLIAWYENAKRDFKAISPH